MFEVTLIREIKNPMDLQAIVNAFITQKIDDCDMVYTFKTKDITFESKEEVKWTLDGEFGGVHNNVNLKVCQKAVDFIVKKRRKKEEKDLFLKLISVKGIGCKSACTMLASGDVEGICEAIESGNMTYLKKIPGIGPKD